MANNAASGTPQVWHVYGLGDAHKPRDPVQYIVDGMFRLPSLSIVFGAPGTLKSMLLTDMGVCIAGGKPWLGPAPGDEARVERQTLRKPVLWCDFDNGPLVMHERIKAISRCHGVPLDSPFHYVSMPRPWLDASSVESMMLLENLVDGLEAKCVIIDNLRDISGGVDENGAAMGDVMSLLRRLADNSGSAVLLIHHQRKGKQV